ncbi:MAG: hypothetical protein AAGE52_05950, partial [Myxococcota bacterium]
GGCRDDQECTVANGEGACRDGVCAVLRCDAPFADCDGDPSNGCEVDTAESLDHCGACDARCDVPSANETCELGECRIGDCVEGFDDCNGLLSDGCEARLDSVATCGSCLQSCDADTPICNASVDPFVCVEDCPGGATLCDRRCVDAQNDPLNCGGCDPCPVPERATATCSAAVCGFACEDGFGNCNDDGDDGCETNVTTSLEHCGACDAPCEGGNATWTCDGTCQVAACDDGFADCNGDPEDGCEESLNDNDHCGACFAVCEEACVDEVCDPVVGFDGERDHSCAVRLSGRLYCWGRNNRGQVGDGTTIDRLEATLVTNPATGMPLRVQGVATGFLHTCALDLDGELWCWGNATYGVLAQPGGAPILRPQRAMGDATFEARTFTQIEAAQWSNCVLDDLRRVWCWGRNDAAQLGLGSTLSLNNPMPQRVLNLDSDVAEISVGLRHGCARLADGTVRCWGQNATAEVGTGTTMMVFEATDVGLSDIATISTGSQHTCAADSSGALYCWGDNTFNQLGLVPTSQVDSPMRIDAIEDVANLSAGASETCAAIGGLARCWGNRSSGQLGDGLFAPTTAVPVAPLVIAPDSRLFTVGHTCGISEGELFCWGDNASGQLGYGEGGAARSATPERVRGL